VQSAAEADVRIRTSGLDWMGPVVLGGLGLMLAALPGTGQPGFALYWLIYGALMVAEGLWMRTFGVDLRPEFAGVRAFRKRRLPWPQVQAVVRHRRLGTWVVRLILESGELVTLRAPTSPWGSSAARYERDFHAIGQCWLTHRGQSWRPQRPEAPPLLAQP
jgi:hypothetical protein